MVVTRFAPSPTGYLHVGGARTALFNWLLARHSGGRFLLRIEDTDLARSTQDAVRQLVADLKWLGLDWDNEQLIYQSSRLDLYNRVIDDLVARDLAYEAWETPAELDALRQQAEKAKRAFLYRRPKYTADDLQRFADEGRKPIIRFQMPAKEYRFRDETLGKEVVLGPAEAQDFVIRKTDGMPTYHFGVVIDDAEMGVTHVLRGQEHLKNTFNHIALQEALGYPRPIYAHLSVMLNPETGEKLSKRDRDRRIRRRLQELMKSTKRASGEYADSAGLPAARIDEWLLNDTMQLDLAEQMQVMRALGMKESDLPEIMVHDFRKNGYVPEVLNNFLALQGWNPGGDREQMTMQEMIELFSLDRINPANPRFSRDKLQAFSTDYFARTEPTALVSAMRDFLAANPDSPLNQATDEQLAQLLEMKKGFRTLREVDEPCRFFFMSDDDIIYDPAAVEKVLKKQNGLAVLGHIRPVLEQVSDWTAAALEPVVQAFCTENNLGLGKVAQPIRVALSGTTISPPIFQSLEFVGKVKTLARIDRCLAQLA